MNSHRIARLSGSEPAEPSFVPDLLTSMSGADLLLLRVKMGVWIAPEIDAELDRRATGEFPRSTGPWCGEPPFRIRRSHHRRRAPAA